MTTDLANAAYVTGRGLVGASTATTAGTLTSTLSGGNASSRAAALVTFAI